MYADDLVERRVGANAELSAWNVVADGRRYHNDRNTELLVLVARLSQHQSTVVRLHTELRQQLLSRNITQ